MKDTNYESRPFTDDEIQKIIADKKKERGNDNATGK